MAQRVPAVAYLRTSSAANVEGDSAFRQDDAIARYAARADLDVVACYWDAAVSGADPIQDRDGFLSMLDYLRDSGVVAVVVENPSRFARDYLVQGNGLVLLASRGIRVFDASTGHDLTDTGDPMRKAMVAMMGVFAGLEKDMLVAKLRHARERKRALTGKCEGRKAWSERDPELVRQVKRLARRSPKTGRRRSLREIAAELAALGWTTRTGRPFSPSQVQDLLAQAERLPNRVVANTNQED